MKDLKRYECQIQSLVSFFLCQNYFASVSILFFARLFGNDCDMLIVLCFVMFWSTVPYMKVGYTCVVIGMVCYSL